ncbi:pdz domain protein arc, putative [Pediculus humanus corporis]|uniref:Pdz domain protein arc, putative n=1 Tax=Pediculus humanus subsp. corporis TaxID=121224 RepID=E0VAS6_PEDHC|nr:pdz domain protein arc, putative [Pediculus humanus corporis]EEB10482.1 pdz domain protein arc, putative [Pediculus humanus corporis]
MSRKRFKRRSTILKYLSLWNKGISQKWRRLRRRCTSFTTGSSVNNYISSQGHLHRESLLDLDATCDVPVIRRNSGGSSSGSIVITPKRVMPPSKDNDVFPKSDTLSLDGSFLSPKPPKSKSSSDKILSDVQQMLRSKLNRIHAGLRKRRAVSIHEVQTNRAQQHPIFYVPLPLNSSSQNGSSIHDNIVERDDENDDDCTGHLSLPPFAFRDSNDKVNYELNSKTSSVCSSGRGTCASDDGDRRSTSSNRSLASGKDVNENGDYTWGKDNGYHSIEIQQQQQQQYDRVYCDKWTSPTRDKITSNDILNDHNRFDFIHASEKRNNVKFAVNESTKNMETPVTKFCRARLSEHSKNHHYLTSRFSACEPSKNFFHIGSPITNRFITCQTFTDSGPSSLPYSIQENSNYDNDKKLLNPLPILEDLPPKGDRKMTSSAALSQALRNRTRSQSPLKKGIKNYCKKNVWDNNNDDKNEEKNFEENDNTSLRINGSRENLPLKLDSDSADDEKESSKFCTLPRHGKGSGFSILTVTFTKGPGQKGLGFSIVGGRDSPKGHMGIYVKTIFPTGQAAESGALKEGDEILAVNQKPFHGLSHQEAINVFKEIKNGAVQLHVGRRQYKKR